MKKRIALFANGWTTENLVNFIKAMEADLPRDYADIFMFMSYSSYGMDPVERRADGMIYKLPLLESFDAAVVFGPGINFSEEIEAIYDSIDKAGSPAISVGLPHKDTTCLSVDNVPGMKDLCNHLMDVHSAGSFAYLAGSADNADSNIRLTVLRECAKAHGLNDEDIKVYYTNWEVRGCRAAIKDIISDKLPDAIICANDLLAIHAVLTLTEAGFSVPEDVIVTGFDNLSDGQNFYPALTSVDQCYSDLGKQAALRLKGLLNGDRTAYTDYIDSTFIAKESCGCTGFDGDTARRHYAFLRPYASQKNYEINGRLFSLEQAILKSQNYKELSANIKAIFDKDVDMEGGTFYMMLDPLFENIGNDQPLPTYQFSDEFDITTGKSNTIPTTATTVSRRLLIPECDITVENRIYTFIPIYYESFSCGYLAFGDALDAISEASLFLFNNRINRILMFLKRNVQLNELNNRLSELMDQDALTRVKNRTAYDKYLKNLEADFIEGENKPFAVVYFDINNLKIINDMYGHEKGDAYIKNSCRLICNTFKHSPVFRIGGDEFVSIAQNDDYTNRHELLRGMRDHMKALKEKGDSVPLTERISIASGMAEYDRTLDEDFASIFKRADELMYENKYNMKNPGV